MKIFILSVLVTLSAAHSLPADEGKHLFILSGQSNMAGLNPKLSFIPAVEAEFGGDRVIVVKDAQGGRPISRWYKDWKPAKGNAPQDNGDLYDRLMTKVNPAIKGEKIASVTFIWMQGESDAKNSHAEVYEDSLKGLIKQLARDLGRKEIHFVIGRISDSGMKNENWVLIRKAQVSLAESTPRGAWVDTDDLNNKTNKQGELYNDLHYTGEGYKILGQRFADKAITLIKK